MQLLIDGDALLYPPLLAHLSEEVDANDEIAYATVSLPACQVDVQNEIARYMEITDATSYIVAFSCPSSECFRRTLYPDYKKNRSGRKPLGFSRLREWCESTFPSQTFPTLEADDILGIMQTLPGGDTMIVGVDKDFLTIPGRVMSPVTGEIIEVSEEEADYNHLFQTLTGDPTDGYSGARGIGPVKAAAILEEPSWVSVVRAFGGDEDAALLQARLARILRVEDWNFDKREVKLWSPKVFVNAPA